MKKTDAGNRRRERSPESGSATITEVSEVAPPNVARESGAPQDAARQSERVSAADSTDEGAPPREPAADTLDAAELAKLWDGFITFVRQKKVSLGVCLLSGKIYSFDGKRLILRFMKNFSLQKDQVAKESNTAHLQSMFKKYFGHDVDLVCFLEGEERAIALEEKARVQAQPKERLRDVSEENKPVVRKIMDEFDGEIVRYNR